MNDVVTLLRPHPSATPKRNSAQRRETLYLRWMSDWLHLWCLCERASCRRTRACCGEPRACLPHYGPLVTAEARDWVQEMIDAKRERRDFDVFMDEAETDIAAYLDWQNTALDFAARRRKRRYKQA